MNATGHDRLTLQRSWGVIALRIVEDAFGSRVELVKRTLDGKEQPLAFKPEELPRLEEAVREVRRLYLGHEKHQPKEADPVLGGGTTR